MMGLKFALSGLFQYSLHYLSPSFSMINLIFRGFFTHSASLLVQLLTSNKVTVSILFVLQ